MEIQRPKSLLESMSHDGELHQGYKWLEVLSGSDLENMLKAELIGFAGRLERNCEVEDGYDFGLNNWKNGVDIYWKGEDRGKHLGQKRKFYFRHVKLRCI